MIHHSKKTLVAYGAFFGVFMLAATIVLQNIVVARSISEIQQEINQRAAEQQSAQGVADTLGQQASGIQGEIDALVAQIAGVQAQIDSNTARQNQLQLEIEAAQKKLDEQKELLAINLRSRYIDDDISTLEMVASSKNISEFFDKQEYREQIQSNINSTMEEIDQLKTQLSDQKAEVERILVEQRQLKVTLDQKNAEAAAKLAQVNQEKGAFDAQVAAKKGAIANLQNEMAAAQAAITRAARGSSSMGAVSNGAYIGTVGNTGNSFGSHLHLGAWVGGSRIVNPFNYLGSRWRHPVNAPISQYFGENPWHYGYGGAGHDGVDYAAPSGTPIYAVEPGELISKRWFGPYGCAAMVRHSDGLVSLYAHMEAHNCN